jgi:hypothetical protein
MVKSQVWTAVSKAGNGCRGAVEDNVCEERVLACATSQMAGLK